MSTKKKGFLQRLKDKSQSIELEAGVHENVRLISIDTELKKDKNGKLIERHLYLRFKKFSKSGKDVGEKEINFFMVDPLSDYALDSLINFMERCWSIVRVYKGDDAKADKAFNPIQAIANRDNFPDMDEKEFDEYISYDFIKQNVLKKAKDYKAVEESARKMMEKALNKDIGINSIPLRLRLEASKDKKYVQIPRYTPFIEDGKVKKTDSILNY